MLDLAAVLKTAGLTREQLVDAAILIGTDYNEGVDGVGPVKAVKLVKQGKRPEDSGITNADEVRGLYFSHPVDKKFVPKFGKPNEKATLAFLAKRGIDENRGRTLLEALGA
jgi:flap endonuclease-1